MPHLAERISPAFLLIACLFFGSCSNQFPEPKLPLSLSTAEPSGISSVSAESGGKFYSDGGSPILQKGVCWGTEENPQADSLNSTRDGSGSENFISRLVNLLPNKLYFARAYAKNEAGIAYGNQVSFRTSGIDSLFCSRIVHEGILSAGIAGEAVSKLSYLGRNAGAYPALTVNSTNGIAGLSARIEAGAFLPDSGVLHIRISGIPSRAGAALFYINIGGKRCNLYRQVGVADPEGNHYETQSMGNQVWMKENLRSGRYRNGDLIPFIDADSLWASTETGACAVQPVPAGSDTLYGKLYNWYAVSDPRGLCPAGFRIPDDADWTALELNFGGRVLSGGKLKAMGTIENGDGLWFNPNTGATNSSGFSALPGGYRNFGGQLLGSGQFGYWWSGTPADGQNSWYRSLAYLNANSNRNLSDKRNGFSVRCIRD